MLDIDTAIKHCLEVAEKNESKAQKIGCQFLGTTKDREATECRECAADHRQLAEWLTELKELRNSLGAVKLSNMKEARELIRDYKAENITQKKLIAEYKRLLKAAVDDINAAEACDTCEYYPVINSDMCQKDDCYKWRYADEALALIGEDGDTNG